MSRLITKSESPITKHGNTNFTFKKEGAEDKSYSKQEVKSNNKIEQLFNMGYNSLSKYCSKSEDPAVYGSEQDGSSERETSSNNEDSSCSDDTSDSSDSSDHSGSSENDISSERDDSSSEHGHDDSSENTSDDDSDGSSEQYNSNQLDHRDNGSNGKETKTDTSTIKNDTVFGTLCDNICTDKQPDRSILELECLKFSELLGSGIVTTNKQVLCSQLGYIMDIIHSIEKPTKINTK